MNVVGDLVSLIHERLTNAQRTYCASLPAFLKLRATVRESSENDSLRIRPHDKIVVVLTPRQRRDLWKRLAHLLGTTPRQLRRPPALQSTLAATTLELLFLAFWTAASIDLQIMPLTLAIAVVAIYCLNVFTSQFRVTPPRAS